MRRRFVTAAAVAVLLATIMVGHDVIANPHGYIDCTAWWNELGCWLLGF